MLLVEGDVQRLRRENQYLVNQTERMKEKYLPSNAEAYSKQEKAIAVVEVVEVLVSKGFGGRMFKN